MYTALKYMPILRGRQEELKVIKSFDFGNRIYPCLEIIKEVLRLPPQTRRITKRLKIDKPTKQFENVYLPLINSVRADRVFVDLPVHLKDDRGMKKETLHFLRTVVYDRQKRTEYMNKLAILSKKIIPVVSTYYNFINNERNSIILQENDLRRNFPVIAFRTFSDCFLSRDRNQIKSVLRSSDYLIFDWQETQLDTEDEAQQEILDELRRLDCTVITHRNPFPKKITNVGLDHGNIVSQIDNSLINEHDFYGGDCFSDYAGVKKDDISDGGTISPGFIFYDAVENSFYGYKGRLNDLNTFETMIIPSVLNSEAANRMKIHRLDFLGRSNRGWNIIESMSKGTEPCRSPAKFKRISIEHYLHCIKEKIENDDFNYF